MRLRPTRVTLRMCGRCSGALVVALALLMVNMSGCGGGSSAVVVNVGGGNVVRREMVLHWMRVAALRDGEESGYVGGVPDPPRYTRCIKELAAAPPTALRPARGRSVLKGECAQRYEGLKTQVLQSLITAEWFFAEGKARGLSVSSAEERARVARVSRNRFATRAAWEGYLRRGGETEADQMFRSKIKLYSAKIEQQLAPGGSASERQRALIEFVKGFPAKWAPRTRCQSGYVVADCAQYKGSIPPSAQLL